MAPVAAIWGIVTSSINAINTVKSWIQELGKFQKEVGQAEQTLNTLMLTYQKSQAVLEAWAKMWEIKDTSKDYPRGLWGKTASEVVESHLKSISKLHQEIQVLLGMTLRETSISDKNKSISSLKVVTKTAPDALTKFEIIETQMATVIARSEEAFKHKHQRVMLSEKSREILTEARGKIFLKAVYNSRIPSKALYDSFCDAKNQFKSKNVHLKMDICQQDLDPKDSTGVYQLQYFLYFPVQATIEEYTVEGPLPANADHSPNSNSLYKACVDTRKSSAKHSFKVGEAWFDSRIPNDSGQVIPHEQDARRHRLKPLASILYDLDTKIAKQPAAPAATFPLQERIRFAFKIAQWGFFLCGTSWMVNLRLKNIRSIRDSQKNRHFLLETEASRIVLNDARDEGKEQIHQFAKHAFSIGILLLEIGTSRKVEKLDYDIDRGFYFYLCLAGSTDPATDTIKTMDQVSRILQKDFGSDYVKAVETCLYCEETWIRDTKKESLRPKALYNRILGEYYDHVYSPLRRLERLRRQYTMLWE